MNLRVYKDSLVYGFTQVSNYRSEVWLILLNKAIYLSGIIFFWSVIGKSANGVTGLSSVLSYFLIANGVQGLVDAESLRFSRVFTAEVKNGGLNSHLLRPLNPVLFIYFSFMGARGMIMLMTVLMMVVGWIFLPQVAWWQLLLFVVSLFFGFVISFVINLMVGCTSFWTSEASNLQNVASHFVRIFSGVMIPLSFFSPTVRNLLLLSPFPAMAYLPSIIMQTSTITREIWTLFGATIFWSVILLPLSFWFWRKGLKQYEAIGI